MNKVTAMDGDVRYVRVSKVAARRAYNAGKPVVLCPAKLCPFGGFRPSCMVQGGEAEDNFDSTVQNFEWYNCQLNETGYYAAFYIAA